MKTTFIVSEIYKDFAKTYKNASKFVNSGALWDFCIDTISDPVLLSCIVFANDHGIPPVKSLLTIYERQNKPNKNFKFTATEAQNLGSLMGFVFKFILGYNVQFERCKVGKLGVKTATRYERNSGGLEEESFVIKEDLYLWEFTK